MVDGKFPIELIGENFIDKSYQQKRENRRCIEENKEHIFNFVKVKAHSSDKWNDKADYLAGACFR